ncbi:MAG TPA: oligoendopeptidase F [Chloroflexota bacterium]|nr:oligoendopeptidase F [Chloroflexota bacterium]
MAQVTKLRSEIPVQYTWDTDSIFASVADWEAAIEELGTRLEELGGYHGRLHESPATLTTFMAKLETMQRQLSHIFNYAGLNYSVDTNDQEWTARQDRARGLLSRATASIAFAEPELLQIGFDTLRQWLADDEQLAIYAHYLDRLEKRQAHVRSAEVEQLLGQVQDPLGTANSTHSVLANADLKFTPATDSQGESYDITQGSIGSLTTHTDRDVRRTAWENYADGHLAFKNTMANALAGGVKRDVFFARARRYQDSLDAALSSTFIPPAVFHNLIDTFKANLPTWHRYWAIRRRALGLDALQPYDVKAPLSRQEPVVPYETAVDWIAAGMQPLGDEYVSILRRGCLEERWVDVYPNQGKRMGAFSSGSPGTRPFIMMSYSDDLFGLSTLAHELGHSLHSYYTWQNQKIMAYARYGLFVAEVASNFNQAMVRAHLLTTQADPEFQIAVIEEAMANFHRYFFIMPTLARFELEIHERVERGQALTADSLINLMADLFAEGFGDEVVMDRERVGITWAQFHTHLYSNFYVYQYATGISAAHALADGILAGTPDAAPNYLAFLKAGGSVYPLEALQLAGVDMTTPTAVETTFGVLAGYVDRLEHLIKARD